MAFDNTTSGHSVDGKYSIRTNQNRGNKMAGHHTARISLFLQCNLRYQRLLQCIFVFDISLVLTSFYILIGHWSILARGKQLDTQTVLTIRTNMDMGTVLDTFSFLHSVQCILIRQFLPMSNSIVCSHRNATRMKHFNSLKVSTNQNDEHSLTLVTSWRPGSPRLTRKQSKTHFQLWAITYGS